MSSVAVSTSALMVTVPAMIAALTASYSSTVKVDSLQEVSAVGRPTYSPSAREKLETLAP